MPGDGECRPRRELVLLARALLDGLTRLAQVVPGRLRLGGDVAEVFLDDRARGLHVHVARDHERGVVGGVERREKLLHVGQRCGIELGQVAVEVVRVVPVRVGQLRHVEPRKATIRLVEHVHLDLVLHHALLVDEVLLRDHEAAHPVGFGPERGLQRVGRHDFEVVRVVETGGAVQDSAGALDELDELHLAEVFRALEHHVLEEMREAGAPLRLDAEADAVVHGDRGRRHRLVGGDHDAQPILEREVGVRDVEPRGGGGLHRLLGGKRGQGQPAGAGEQRARDHRGKTHREGLRTGEARAMPHPDVHDASDRCRMGQAPSSVDRTQRRIPPSTPVPRRGSAGRGPPARPRLPGVLR